ncbi:MAG: stalk domain-containing protein [Oscillospiraceae bacterium]|nr:stalk domain-containing protein [Oscillospiraceae bacterium]
MKKKRIAVTVCLTAAFLICAAGPALPAAAEGADISVEVDGVKVEFDQPPVNINGRILVPLRFVLEKTGCAVDWDGATQTVYVTTEAGPPEKSASPGNGITVCVDNEMIIFPDQQPVNINGRVLVPIRFVVEKLGYDVDWNGAAQTVYITKRDSEAAASVLTVHFIDVGQGDAIFIDFGTYEILIDAGLQRYGSAVAEYIAPYTDGAIELIVASHPDADHIGGLVDVINSFPVDRILHNGEEKDTNVYRAFRSAAETKENCEFTVAADTVITIGDGAALRIITPGKRYADTNDNSIVCILTYNEVSVCFAGDAEEKAEKDLIGRVPEVDVLKAAHHGSRTSSGAELLRVLRPDYVIISAGFGNTYKHPHPEALQRFFDTGATVYGTFRDKTIIMETDGKTYSFSAETALTLRDAGAAA